MTSKVKTRLDKLEQAQAMSGAVVIAFDFGDGFLTVNGEKLTEQEFYRRYPKSKDDIVINYPDDKEQ